MITPVKPKSKMTYSEKKVWNRFCVLNKEGLDMDEILSQLSNEFGIDKTSLVYESVKDIYES